MELIILITLLVITYFTGSIVEKKHYASIRKREAETADVAVLNVKKVDLDNVHSTQYVSANVVVGADYFKRFLAGLRNIFGGKVASLESLMDRARREATLRVKKQAIGATYVTNLRYETTTLAKEMVEVIAYATAVYTNNSNENPAPQAN